MELIRRMLIGRDDATFLEWERVGYGGNHQVGVSILFMPPWSSCTTTTTTTTATVSTRNDANHQLLPRLTRDQWLIRNSSDRFLLLSAHLSPPTKVGTGLGVGADGYLWRIDRRPSTVWWRWLPVRLYLYPTSFALLGQPRRQARVPVPSAGLSSDQADRVMIGPY